MNLEKPVNLEEAKGNAGPKGLETKAEVEKCTADLIGRFNHKINQEPFLGRWSEKISTDGEREFSVLCGACVKWQNAFNNSGRSYKASFHTMDMPHDGTSIRGSIELVVEEREALSKLKGLNVDFGLDD